MLILCLFDECKFVDYRLFIWWLLNDYSKIIQLFIDYLKSIWRLFDVNWMIIDWLLKLGKCIYEKRTGWDNPEPELANCTGSISISRVLFQMMDLSWIIYDKQWIIRCWLLMDDRSNNHIIMSEYTNNVDNQWSKFLWGKSPKFFWFFLWWLP